MPRKKRIIMERESFLSGWDEIESYTGLSRWVLLPEIKAGRLDVKKIGRRWVTTKDACLKWMARR